MLPTYPFIASGVMMNVWNSLGYSRLQSGDWSLLEDFQPACQELHRAAYGLQAGSGVQGAAIGGTQQGLLPKESSVPRGVC